MHQRSKMLRLAVVLGLIALALAASVATVFAAPDHPPGLNWGTEVNANACGDVGKLVINVNEKIVNTVDSGEGGNYWAFDDLTRRIQVWETEAPGVYCALVQNQGKFDAQAGQTSPGAGYTLDGDEDGTFQGGYHATITGTLKDPADWPTRGPVGTTDYDCDISGNCPGYVNWVAQYFEPGYGFSYEWWGWIYRAGRHGVWVNSSDGNAGDLD